MSDDKLVVKNFVYDYIYTNVDILKWKNQILD
jgi:hypothetical protein